MRIGMGYDIHRLVPGNELILGGVQIPFAFGLEGHSDADVLLHALMDALLGAAALGDIGHHFPPNDDQFEGSSSRDLLASVGSLLQAHSARIINVDVTLIAEAPRIRPHVEQMRTLIAATLGIRQDCVSIKATTNEGVGPEGRGEAMSAQAVALIDVAS